MTDIHTSEIERPEQGDDAATSAADTGRRSLLTKGVLAAAVGAVAGSTLSRSASAANGATFIIGDVGEAASNVATNTTRLTGGSTLEVVNGTSEGDASIYGRHSSTEGIGVHGRATGSQGRGVFGQSTGDGGRGVYGVSSGSDGVGVYGAHTGTTSGTGVIGMSSDGTGVSGVGTSVDLRANGVGRIGITAGAAITPTTTGGPGLLGRDDQGGLWYSPASGVFRELAGAGTAGSLHPVSPYRAYDSRRPQPQQGKLAGAGQTRIISVKDERDTTGAVVNTDLVPAGATAVAFTITVVQTELSGNLSVADGDAVSTTASTINWDMPNAIVANSSIVKLNASREIKVFNNTQAAGALTHFIIDITGYYL